jgi:DNA-binding MarR family transcriptional regulator
MKSQEIDDTVLRLGGFIPYRLMTAAEKVSLDFSQIYKRQTGISRPEWRVLASLAELARATATEIGRHSSMHKTKVSRAVFELEQRRWLKRLADETDRRAEWLELTALGKSQFSKLALMAHDYQAGLVKALGREEAKQLLQILDKLDSLSI